MAQYDVVITGGRVIDPETGLDAVRNVGSSGEKIATVTDEATEGKETIDDSGHGVCPGFIDMHQHNSAVPFGEKPAIYDGTTTPLKLEGGGYPMDEWYAGLHSRSRSWCSDWPQNTDRRPTSTHVSRVRSRQPAGSWDVSR